MTRDPAGPELQDVEAGRAVPGGTVPSGPASEGRRSPPWRELLLGAAILSLGWPVALLAFVLPLAAFFARLESGLRRAAGTLLAASIPAFMLFVAPGSRFFVLAALLATAAGLLQIHAGVRPGYAELTLAVMTGLAAAASAAFVSEPGFFPRVQAELEASTLEQGRLWVETVARRVRLEPSARLVLEDTVAASATWSSRAWPAGVFATLWLGGGAALGIAAAGARAAATAGGVRARQSWALFRLPDAWIGLFLAGVAAYLLFPGMPEPISSAGPSSGSAPPLVSSARAALATLHDVGLNVALIAGGLYACQGLGVAVYYLDRRGMRPLARTLLVVSGMLLLPLPLLIVSLGLGLADAGLDLRFRAARRAPGPPRA
ncbi:MAG: DUF2232 domain-containing protein [Gemmatimonadetes bacterium]|nr:DUF2232 domain-containing protein [Gemmatimonadota bacterium]